MPLELILPKCTQFDHTHFGLKNGVQFLYLSNFVELVFEVWSKKEVTCNSS